jgi:hypothetical protein
MNKQNIRKNRQKNNLSESGFAGLSGKAEFALADVRYAKSVLGNFCPKRFSIRWATGKPNPNTRISGF